MKYKVTVEITLDSDIDPNLEDKECAYYYVEAHLEYGVGLLKESGCVVHMSSTEIK